MARLEHTDHTTPTRTHLRQDTMEIFEQGKTPENTSHWITFGDHLLSAAGAPGKRRIPVWEEAGITDVITLQREDEMNARIPILCEERGWRWHHIPLSGKKLEATSDPTSLSALAELARELIEDDDPRRRIVVHCSAGLHRTGVALYLMLRLTGLDVEETIAKIASARALTAHELTRVSRRDDKRLADRAEAFYRELAST